MSTVIWLFVASLVALIIIIQVGVRYLYGYKIDEEHIHVCLFNKIPIVKIPYSEIESISEISFKETLIPENLIDYLTVIRFGNRIWGRAIKIKTKRPLFKIWFLTPDDTDQFMLVYEVNKRLKK